MALLEYKSGHGQVQQPHRKNYKNNKVVLRLPHRGQIMLIL